jgi:hypothetical protein
MIEQFVGIDLKPLSAANVSSGEKEPVCSILEGFIKASKARNCDEEYISTRGGFRVEEKDGTPTRHR